MGFDNICGYFKDGVKVWKENLGDVIYAEQIGVEKFVEKIKSGAKIIDIRTKDETKDGYIKGSDLVPLQELIKNYSLISENGVTLYCRTGYRVQITFSLLTNRKV